jgi:putative tricarboxylic transport membrane protein
MPAAAIAVFLGAVCGAYAQQSSAEWKPVGNVELHVGAGPGGENDRVARAIQRVLTREHLVDSMTVLNKPGAVQVIAMTDVARKVGDANELGLASGSFINALARKGSDPSTQLTPIVKLFDAYQCYFTAVDSPLQNMIDIRNRLKTDPGSVTFAIPVGLGTPLHFSVISLGASVGAPPGKMVVVAFDSGSDVAEQAAGGHVDVGATSIGGAMPLIDGGKLRMLGIAAPERLPGELAKYPTLREQGLDIVTANSYTVFVPNGLTPAQIGFWRKALDRVMVDEDFKRDLALNYWVLRPVRYPETVKWVQDDYDENRTLLTELGLLQ